MTADSRQPLVYTYLDVNGVDSLFAQTTDRLDTESKTTTERGEEKSTSWKAALRLLLGGGEVAGATVRSGKDIEEVTSRLTTEHKLERLIRYLRGFEYWRYFESLEPAAEQCDQMGGMVYLKVQRAFDVPAFYDGGGGVDEVNREHAVFFEINAPSAVKHDDSDHYFRNAPYVAMNANLENFPRLRGAMGRGSHDTLVFRRAAGRGVQLGVFGALSHMGARSYVLRPFAIWVPM